MALQYEIDSTNVPGTPHNGYTVITDDNIHDCVIQYFKDEETDKNHGLKKLKSKWKTGMFPR